MINFHEHIKNIDNPKHFKIELIKNYSCYSERELKSEESKEIHKAIIKGDKVFNTLETKNIKEPKNQIVQQHLLNKRQKERFEIIEDEKNQLFQIQYRDEEGKKKLIRKRYKRRPREKVYEEMLDERKQLLDSLKYIEMDKEDETIFKETPNIIHQLMKSTDDLNNKKYNKIKIEFD